MAIKRPSNRDDENIEDDEYAIGTELSEEPQKYKEESLAIVGNKKGEKGEAKAAKPKEEDKDKVADRDLDDVPAIDFTGKKKSKPNKTVSAATKKTRYQRLKPKPAPAKANEISTSNSVDNSRTKEDKVEVVSEIDAVDSTVADTAKLKHENEDPTTEEEEVVDNWEERSLESLVLSKSTFVGEVGYHNWFSDPETRGDGPGESSKPVFNPPSLVEDCDCDLNEPAEPAKASQVDSIVAEEEVVVDNWEERSSESKEEDEDKVVEQETVSGFSSSALDHATSSSSRPPSPAVLPRPKVDPFGGATPREVVLKGRGVDWKEIDAELAEKGKDWKKHVALGEKGKDRKKHVALGEKGNDWKKHVALGEKGKDWKKHVAGMTKVKKVPIFDWMAEKKKKLEKEINLLESEVSKESKVIKELEESKGSGSGEEALKSEVIKESEESEGSGSGEEALKSEVIKESEGSGSVEEAKERRSFWERLLVSKKISLEIFMKHHDRSDQRPPSPTGEE